jgi:spoIIIJ-associated protein
MAREKESVEATARTVEEAIEQCLSELGVPREQAEVEILESGRGGLLGLGAQDALVRLTRLPLPEEGRELAEPAVPDEELGPQPVLEEQDVSLPGVEILQDLIDKMGVRGRVVVRSGEDLAEEGEVLPLVLDVTGKDLGILIGRRGETLQALQFLTRLMLSKRLSRWEPVVVDVESYRARRRRSLRRLALRMAERAASSQRLVVLEAMPPHERRILHLALRDNLEVTTESTGEGEHRQVTIVPRQ